MQSKMTTTFSITDKINPVTNEPFGEAYAGTFSIRRPSLLDKKNIAVKDAASLSFAGNIPDGMISNGITLVSYIFAFVSTVAESPLPEWFDMGKMYDDSDEEAVIGVWTEVVKFLESFRQKKDR